MKTGEKNFIQQFIITGEKEKTSRYGNQHLTMDGLREIFPELSDKLSEFSQDRMFPMCVPLLAAAAVMFLDQVKSDLNKKKRADDISDLTQLPLKVDGNFLHAIFVVDGKAVIMRGDLVDINMFDDADIVIGLINAAVIWGPRKEGRKLFSALERFIKEAGLERIKKEAKAMLTENKQAAKYLPPVVKKFYGI